MLVPQVLPLMTSLTSTARSRLSLLNREDRDFARQVVAEQERVLDDYLAGDAAPSVRMVAELGLSIDTLSRLQRYVRGLDDWQLVAVTHVLYGGSINF